jgi:hypothetical protein
MAQPRHHTPRSPDRPTRGAALAQVAQVKARPLMPWQRRAGDVALELDVVSRHYAFGIVIVSVPRQAGKTKLESDVADHRCLTLPGARCWITMQNGKTVDSWMREEHFASLARATPFGVAGRPSARYDQVRRAGEVGVRWRHGSTFYTFPPKRDALHSKQSDLAMVDEAWAHDAQTGADIRQAIRPTMATRRGAQLWIVSTMGDDASVFFDDYVEMGRAAVGNPHSRVCFVDYGIGDDVDPEDLQAIADAHPAYGHTINMQTLVDAREDFGARLRQPSHPHPRVGIQLRRLDDRRPAAHRRARARRHQPRRDPVRRPCRAGCRLARRPGARARRARRVARIRRAAVCRPALP